MVEKKKAPKKKVAKKKVVKKVAKKKVVKKVAKKASKKTATKKPNKAAQKAEQRLRDANPTPLKKICTRTGKFVLIAAIAVLIFCLATNLD